MRNAFEEIAKGTYMISEIYLQAKQSGITCGVSNFYNIIRNPVYCGKITVPKYKDEEEYLVDGQHEALISERLFYRVQDIINGKKRNIHTRIVSEDLLPLTGFLDCPKCNRKLTGSASKGRKQYYYYYHCSTSCGCRFKAGEVNAYMEKKVKKLWIREGYEPFYHNVLLRLYKTNSGCGDLSRKEILNQIKELQEKVVQARDYYLDGKLEERHYKEVKNKAENDILILEKLLP